MDDRRLIDGLEQFSMILPQAVAGLAEGESRWRPDDGAWSVLEVVRHLVDEETSDFRVRVELTLRNPSEAWPPIDPEGWAKERAYNEGRLDDAVNRFVAERRRSVAWLRSLADPQWDNTHQHPSLGPMRAGDVMAAWAAHDMLHLRQIAKRRFQLIGKHAGVYTTRYAGEWQA